MFCVVPNISPAMLHCVSALPSTGLRSLVVVNASMSVAPICEYVHRHVYMGWNLGDCWEQEHLYLKIDFKQKQRLQNFHIFQIDIMISCKKL